jgi:hypothetical protein
MSRNDAGAVLLLADLLLGGVRVPLALRPTPRHLRVVDALSEIS